MRYDVFISYAHEDHELALTLERIFQSLGWTAFVAPLTIRGGDRWRNELRSGIWESREFVVLVSKASLQSNWVFAECGAAWGFDKRITPILVDVSAAQLPTWLEEYHSIGLKDLESWLSRRLDAKGRVKRFSGGIVQELQLIEVSTGEVKQTSATNRYSIVRGELNLAESETSLGLVFDITDNEVNTSYRLIGRGPGATSFADMEYRVFESGRVASCACTLRIDSKAAGGATGWQEQTHSRGSSTWGRYSSTKRRRWRWRSRIDLFVPQPSDTSADDRLLPAAKSLDGGFCVRVEYESEVARRVETGGVACLGF